MRKILIKNATLINEGYAGIASVLIEGDKIAAVYPEECTIEMERNADEVVDAFGKWLLPGVIDDQVHFREPGLTYKADMHSESMAAVAGGVTSYMEMPNTNPQTTTKEALDWKFNRAAETSVANYSFYMGATNDNIEELYKIDHRCVCGVKLFMGSSTGNMLVDQPVALERIFSEIPALIAVHCEKEEIIRANREYYVSRFGEELPVLFHPLIRSAEACYASSSQAVDLAVRNNARLHLLHLSTARELSLLDDSPLSEKKITGEVCVHHLFFDDNDYAEYGNRIKWNPAIKTCADRLALTEAVSIGGWTTVLSPKERPIPECGSSIWKNFPSRKTFRRAKSRNYEKKENDRQTAGRFSFLYKSRLATKTGDLLFRPPLLHPDRSGRRPTASGNVIFCPA